MKYNKVFCTVIVLSLCAMIAGCTLERIVPEVPSSSTPTAPISTFIPQVPSVTDPPPLETPGAVQKDPIEAYLAQMQQILCDFYAQTWYSFMTLDTPLLPDSVADTPNVHLYLRWVDHRIAELKHPLNSASVLTSMPTVKINDAKIIEQTDNTYQISCGVSLSFQTAGSGVNGMNFGLERAMFTLTDEGLTLTEIQMDYHYPSYMSLYQQFLALNHPTNEDVDRLVDQAITYFIQNNPY